VGLFPAELSHENSAFVAPSRGEAQATEVIGDELKILKANIRCSTLVAMVIEDDGTIRTIQRKSLLQTPLPSAPTIDVFTPARYRVVKITCSCSEVVLQTTKNYKAHYS
jgi:hypothetical protein